MTFRGRYNHVDEATLVLIGLKEMPSGGKIRVLDFAGGVLPFGAPTAHELYDQIAAAGQVPEILVIDKTLPEDLRPSYPDVKYSFDAIRENAWREDHDTLSELVANCQDAAEWFSKSMAPGPGNNFSIAT